MKLFKKSLSYPKNIKVLGTNDSSSIFQDIFQKFFKNQNKNNLNINKEKDFLDVIEDMRLREEMIENEKDFIIKESRREVKLNKEILYLYGKKGGAHKKPKKYINFKLDKKLFLNPLEKSENKYNFIKSKNGLNILRLPIINKKPYNSNSLFENNALFNSMGNSRKISFNDSMNTNCDETKKNNDSYSNLCSNKKNKNKSMKKNKYSFLSLSTPRNLKLNRQSSSKTINNNIFKSYKNFSDLNALNKFVSNKKYKKKVIHILDNIDEELKSDEKKHKIYFRNNDYGCELSKFKINYLEKYFFQ